MWPNFFTGFPFPSIGRANFNTLPTVAVTVGTENVTLELPNHAFRNRESWKLEKKRGVKKGKLFDRMSRTELAANLFRVTQTEELIKSKQISGQANLEQTHYTVGRQVRNIVEQNTGRKPEQLPQEKELPIIKKALKMTAKEMKKIDK